MHTAEKRLPLRYRTEIYINAIKTEGEAARYIREVTQPFTGLTRRSQVTNVSGHQSARDAPNCRAAEEKHVPVRVNKRTSKKRIGTDPSQKAIEIGRRKCRGFGICVDDRRSVACVNAGIRTGRHVASDFRRESERTVGGLQGQGSRHFRVAALRCSPITHCILRREACLRKTASGWRLAFVAGKNTTNWRMTWDVDAVGSANASFRAGGYMKMVHTPPESIHALTPVSPSSSAGTPAPGTATKNFVHPYTVVNLYAQTISLNQAFLLRARQ